MLFDSDTVFEENSVIYSCNLEKGNLNKEINAA